MPHLRKNSFYIFLILICSLPLPVQALLTSSNYRIEETIWETTTRNPAISAVSATAAVTTATVNWTTDLPSDGFVIFDMASAFTDPQEQGSSQVSGTSHSVSLVGLSPATTYFFKVRSATVSGGATTRDDGLSFTTGAEPATVPTPTPPAPSGGGLLIIDKTDKVPPVISGVAIDSVGPDTAAIRWTTDEPSTSFIRYSLGSLTQTMGQWEATTNHRVDLAGLTPSSFYQFKALSSDAWGNLSSSSESSFVTLAPGEAPTKPAENQTATTTPTSTPPAASDDLATALAKANQMLNDLANRAPNALVESGLLGHLQAIDGVLNLLPAPAIQGEPKVEIDGKRVVISWRTEKPANSMVALAPADKYNPRSNEPYQSMIGNPSEYTTDHEVELFGLVPGETYHYQLRSKPRAGKEMRTIDLVFRNNPEGLEISNYAAEVVSPEKANFKWVTNFETTASLRYIPYRGNSLAVNEARTVTDSGYSFIHQATVDGLEGGVVYQIDISGKTKENKVVNKIIDAFSTTKDNLPPMIFQIKTEIAIVPGKDEKTQTIITWSTNEPSTSKVYFRPGAGQFEKDNADSLPVDNNYTRRHVLITTKFKAGDVYSFRVESADASGNASLSGTHTILIPRKKESIFEVIIRILQETFSWVGQIND